MAVLYPLGARLSEFFTDDMYDNYQNTTLRRRRRRPNEQQKKSQKRSKSRTDKKTWYSEGYPALREADKKAREKRNQQKPKSKTGSRRSRSLPHDSSFYDRQRTRSIYKDTTERLRSNSATSVTSTRSRREVFTPSHVIYKTYTGIDSHDEIRSRVGSSYSVRSRIGSSKSNPGGIIHKKVETVKPYKRESYVLSDIQSKSYKKMHETYDVIGTDSKWLTDTMKRLKLEGSRVKSFYTHMDDIYRFLVDGSLKQFEHLNKMTRRYENASKSKYQIQNADSKTLLDAKFRRLSERGLADTMSIQNQGRFNRNPRLKPMGTKPQPPTYDKVNVYMPTEREKGRTLYGNSNRYPRSRSDNTHARSQKFENRRTTRPINSVTYTRRNHPNKLKPLGHNLVKHGGLDNRYAGTRLAT